MGILDSTPWVTTECGLDFSIWSSFKWILTLFNHNSLFPSFPIPAETPLNLKTEVGQKYFSQESYQLAAMYEFSYTRITSRDISKPQKRTHPFKCVGFLFQSLSASACEDNALITWPKSCRGKHNSLHPMVEWQNYTDLPLWVEFTTFCWLIKSDINWRDKASRFPLRWLTTVL